jgi:predicted dehydrogenase
MSWLSKDKHHSWKFLGSNGEIVLDDVAERKLMLTQSGKIIYPEYGSELPLTKELEAFVTSIRTGVLSGPGIDDGLAVVRAIAKAEESIEKGMLRTFKY